MGDTSQSTHFRSFCESALRAYEDNTDITLEEHPLAVQLQNCPDVQSITNLLQQQASDLRGNDRIMTSIQHTVSMLSALSTTAALGGSIGLVCQNALIGYPAHLRVFFRYAHPLMQYRPASLSYLLYVLFLAQPCVSL